MTEEVILQNRSLSLATSDDSRATEVPDEGRLQQEKSAMSDSTNSVARNGSITIALVLWAAVIPASAQTIWIPPRPPIAYTADIWGYPEASGTFQIIASIVVTPFGHSEGPWDSEPTWSPDATRIAFVRSGHIALMDAGSFVVSDTGHVGRSPAWSPDGRRLAFVRGQDEEASIYILNLDGSDVVRVATHFGESPTWSPDSTRIAFTCIVETSNNDICVVHADGTGLVRLTADSGRDAEPAWSLEGNKIAFVTTRYGGSQLAVMNADGSGVSPLAGFEGREPAWSSDGRYVAATGLYSRIYTVKADGSSVWPITYDDESIFTLHSASWMPGSVFPRFSTSCTGLVCSFDATGSVGAITNYTWSFGDTVTASGPVVSHAFAEGGTHTVSLAVTDANGPTATEEVEVTLNRPPIVSFVASCRGLQCTFDGRGSSDDDGTIVDYLWVFGDGSAADFGGGGDTGKMVTHVYPAAGTYRVVLTIRDDSGATATYWLNVTVRGAPRRAQE